MVRLVDKLRTLGEKNRVLLDRGKSIAERMTKTAEAARQATRQQETPEE